jgi:transcriptional regulator with XRE-family HTH domain
MQNRFADQLREAMGDMTQEELEKLSGVAQTTISRLLRSENDPTLRVYEALCRALPRLPELRARAVA